MPTEKDTKHLHLPSIIKIAFLRRMELFVHPTFPSRNIIVKPLQLIQTIQINDPLHPGNTDNLQALYPLQFVKRSRKKGGNEKKRRSSLKSPTTRRTSNQTTHPNIRARTYLQARITFQLSTRYKTKKTRKKGERREEWRGRYLPNGANKSMQLNVDKQSLTSRKKKHV